LIADSQKAKKLIGWKPKIAIYELAKIMVDADMRVLGLEPIGDGDEILKKKFPDRWWRVD
jgi:GDPmannose 4,6-dehydratase